MKKENKNIIFFFLKMIAVYIIFDLLMYKIYPIISEMILYGKYGRNIIIEGICALLILIVLLLFGNSYIFTDKKEKFFKSIGVGGFIFGYGTFLLIYSIISLIGEKGINILDIGSLAIFCILIGIFEEFLCRGWILNEFVERYSSTRKQVILSIFLSSLIFGLIHISNIWVGGQSVIDTIGQIINATGIGVLLGAIYLRTKNIWAIAFLHGYWDFAIFLREINVVKECTEVNVTIESKIVTLVSATIISLIFIVVGLYVFRKSKTKEITKEENIDEETIKKSESKNELYIVAIVVLVFCMGFLPTIEDEEICYEYKEKEITYYEKSYGDYTKYIIDNKIEIKLTDNEKLSIKDLTNNNVEYFDKDIVSRFLVVENNNNIAILIRTINKDRNDTNMYYSNFINKDNITNNQEYLKEIINSFVYLESAPTTSNIGYIKSLEDNTNYPFIETSDSIKLIYYEKEFYILKHKSIEYKEEKSEIINPEQNIEEIINQDNNVVPESEKELINKENEIVED